MFQSLTKSTKFHYNRLSDRIMLSILRGKLLLKVCTRTNYCSLLANLFYCALAHDNWPDCFVHEQTSKFMNNWIVADT